MLQFLQLQSWLEESSKPAPSPSTLRAFSWLQIPIPLILPLQPFACSSSKQILNYSMESHP